MSNNPVLQVKLNGTWTGVPALKGETGNTGPAGKGISSVAKTGTAGLVDTYTITYTDNTTSTYTVTNGTSELESTTGQSTVKGMTQKAITDELTELNEDITDLGFSVVNGQLNTTFII